MLRSKMKPLSAESTARRGNAAFQIYLSADTLTLSFLVSENPVMRHLPHPLRDRMSPSATTASGFVTVS